MRVALLGDIGLFGKYCIVRNPEVSEHFKAISRYLSQFDLVIGNLEVPFAAGCRPIGQKSAHLNSEDRNITLLKELGVHAVSLANNHSFDFGRPGLDRTVEALVGSGIDYFGIDDRHLSIEDHGARIRLRGYCSYTANPLGIQSKAGRPGINQFHYPNVVDKIRADQREGFLTVLSMHSGDEHVNYPSVTDISLARQLADQCPFVYYGHHPHVVQGVESRGDAVLAYSLGNFCFDDVYTSRSSEPLVRQSDNNKLGLILELELRGSEVLNYRAVPVLMGAESLDISDDPKILVELHDRSLALALPLEEIARVRAADLAAYRGDRRKLRDLHWYIKRMNINSLGIVLRARLNRRKHRKTLLQYLNV